jgi:5-methylcytosine-specific restriction endonuclease McrA
MTTKRKRIRRHMLSVIQRNRCVICGGLFRSSARSLEHVVPRSMGGAQAGNLLLSHESCNARRGNTPPTGCMLVMLAAANARLPGMMAQIGRPLS